MQKIEFINGGVTAAKGFRASGIAAEIKYKGRNDVAMIVADAPCDTAAVFTTNKVAAAPVLFDREVAKRGKVQAVLANSGCANACTGKAGLADAKKSAALVAKHLGIPQELVYVASTGVIGRRLPMDRLAAGISKAADQLGDAEKNAHDAALAIMTTDTKPKEIACRVKIGGKVVTVGGMAKGSGMIEPNMATMLAFVTTDANISATMLRRALLLALNKSFNRVVVDGDESTNDSLFVLASGAAGNVRIKSAGEDFRKFLAALEAVCIGLAKKMASDGEGATKFVTVTVKGAKSERDAERAARAVAKSPLAKTSWFGMDPNWGRVLAAVGYSGAEVSDMKAEVFYDGVWAFRRGKIADGGQLAKLAEVMKKDSFSVIVDLHLGKCESTIYTCDFSLDYVHINADYTT